MVLLDDFLVAAPDQSGVHHRCLVTELLLSWDDDCFEHVNKAPLMRQIVDAFDFLHGQGIVHGGNILLHNGNISESM